MKFPEPIPVQQLAKDIGAQLIGNQELIATGINEIHKVELGDVTFSDVEKYFKKSLQSAATIIILNKVVECPKGKAILVHEQPFEVYNKLILKYRPLRPLTQLISETAVIHPSAIIEPNVIIGHHVRIGKYCHIHANVTIEEHSILGNHVTVQSGTVIGSDAFYYKKTAEGFQKWRSGGRVLIEDKVEVGALCTINKGVSGDTIIGEGTKFDCQVHIGHGVVVGKNCLFAAQVGIGGKTIIGDNVVLYGQVGVGQNLKIGGNAIVLGQSGVTKNIAGNKTYFGTPAQETRIKYREMAAVRQLPDFLKKL